MAKGFKGGFGGGNMMRQQQQMQQKIMKMQQDVKEAQERGGPGIYCFRWRRRWSAPR